MSLKSIPTIGDPNWGTPLNSHLAQLQNPDNGGINTFEQFSQRSTNLTTEDKGKTYLYTQTGNLHQWTGTTWKVLNESVINVKDYGAVGDGTNATTQIQFCLDKAALTKGAVYVPNGIYLLLKPLEISSYTTFYGESILGTELRKNNIATGIDLINAVIILKHSDGKYNYYCNIHDFFIRSELANTIDYGIVSQFGTAYLKMSNLHIFSVKVGFSSRDSWLTSFTNSHISNTQAGVIILGGTSLVMSDVYSAGTNVGFWLTNMVYSTLNSCAADNIGYISYQITGCRGLTLNSCGSEGLAAEISSVFYANNSYLTINAPFVVEDYGIMDKGIFFAANNSKVLINNLCMQNIDSKFLYAESNSKITIDEISYFTIVDIGTPYEKFALTPFLQSDKYMEASGGKILTPNKQSSFVNPNNNFANTIKSLNYDATYPAGNNDYNENLNLNLTNEINAMVGANWIKARITFQGNDFTTTSGYAVIDAFQTNGIKTFVLGSFNAGATLVGDTLKIPTILTPGVAGSWYKMKGIYEVTISV